MRAFVILLILAVFAGSLLLMGCEDDDNSPSYLTAPEIDNGEAYDYAVIIREIDQDGELWIELSAVNNYNAYDILRTATISVNGDTLDPQSVDNHTVSGHIDSNINAGDSVYVWLQVDNTEYVATLEVCCDVYANWPYDWETTQPYYLEWELEQNCMAQLLRCEVAYDGFEYDIPQMDVKEVNLSPSARERAVPVNWIVLPDGEWMLDVKLTEYNWTEVNRCLFISYEYTGYEEYNIWNMRSVSTDSDPALPLESLLDVVSRYKQ